MFNGGHNTRRSRSRSCSRLEEPEELLVGNFDQGGDADLPTILNKSQELFQKLIQACPEGDFSPRKETFYIIFPPCPTRKDKLRRAKPTLAKTYLPTMMRDIGLEDAASLVESQYIIQGKQNNRCSREKFLQKLGNYRDRNRAVQIGNLYVKVAFVNDKGGHEYHGPPEWFRHTCEQFFNPSPSSPINNTLSSQEHNDIMLGFSPPPSPAQETNLEQSSTPAQQTMNVYQSTPAQQIDLGEPVPLSGPRWLRTPNLRAALQKVYPKKSIATLKATPSKGVQYIKATAKKFKVQATRKEARRVSAFLHAASNGNHSNAASILSMAIDSIKGMPDALKEKFRGNAIDMSIVDSVSKLLKDLKKKRRTTANQELQDAIAFAIVYYLPPGISMLNLHNRLGISIEALRKAKARAEKIRLAAERGKIIYCHEVKKTRADADINTGKIDCVVNYCHCDFGATRIESNTATAQTVYINELGHPCKKGEHVKVEYHAVRTWDQVLFNSEKYQAFLTSDQYINWKASQPKPDASISETAFIKYICPCVKNPKFQDCADVIMSGLIHAMLAIKRACNARAVWKCQCPYHSTFPSHQTRRLKMLETASRQAELIRLGQQSDNFSDTFISVPNNAEGLAVTAPSNETPVEDAGGTATTSSNHEGEDVNPAEAILQDADNFDVVTEDTVDATTRTENLREDEEVQEMMVNLERLPIDMLVCSTAIKAVDYSCCRRVEHSELACGVGYGTAKVKAPCLLGFKCIAHHRSGPLVNTPLCNICGVAKLLAKYSDCPHFNDNVTTYEVMIWVKVAVNRTTKKQDELRPFQKTMAEMVYHFQAMMVVARVHVVHYEWKSHAQKLDCKMGNPKCESVIATDFMATANLNASEKDNSAQDSHVINAIYFHYHNWRKVRFAVMREMSKEDLRSIEVYEESGENRTCGSGWVWVDNGECHVSECDVYHYCGESETKNKDNNHQYHIASVSDLIEGFAEKREMREELAGQKEWEFETIVKDNETEKKIMNQMEASALDSNDQRLYWAVQGRERESMSCSNINPPYLQESSAFTIPINISSENNPSGNEDTQDSSHRSNANSPSCPPSKDDFSSFQQSMTSEDIHMMMGNDVEVEHELARQDAGELDPVSPTNNSSGNEDTQDSSCRRNANSPSCSPSKDNSSSSTQSTTSDEDIHMMMGNDVEVEYEWVRQDAGELEPLNPNFEDFTAHEYYLDERRRGKWLIILYTDNCGNQYKCRFNISSVASTIERHEFTTTVHRFASKFRFKGNWDGEGKVIKTFWRNNELKHKRTYNATTAVEHAHEEMRIDGPSKYWKNCSPCDAHYRLQKWTHLDWTYDHSKQKTSVYRSDHPRLLEGTGGAFSSDLLERTPPGTTFCSTESILEKNTSTVDRRIIKYTTRSLENYLKASVGEKKKLTCFVDNRPEVCRDPLVQTATRKNPVCKTLAGNTTKMFEFKGTDTAISLSDTYNIKMRQLYCSCPKCKRGKENECTFKKTIEECFGPPIKGPLENELGIREVFTCLCCGKNIYKYELALRHIVHQTCKGLCSVKYPVDEQNIPAYLEVFEKCMVKWDDASCKSECVQKRWTSDTFIYNSLHMLSWTLLCCHGALDNTLENLGLEFGNNLKYPHLLFLNQMLTESSCKSQTPPTFQKNLIIMSIDGVQVKRKEDFYKIITSAFESEGEDALPGTMASATFKILVYKEEAMLDFDIDMESTGSL